MKTDTENLNAEAQRTQRFSRQEIMDGIRELYLDWRVMKARKDGVNSVRLPDFEAALEQIDSEGLSPLRVSAPLRFKKGKEGARERQ